MNTYFSSFFFDEGWSFYRVLSSFHSHLHFKVAEGPITSLFQNVNDLPPYWQVDGNIKNIFDRDNCLPSIWNAEEGTLMIL